MNSRIKKKRNQRDFSVNRRFRDSFFQFLFGRDKARALELYNAVSGTDYTNAEELEIYTLEDVIYMKMKNDVSYLFAREISLYEHQSTVNPNMPLRGLMYFSDQYHKMFGHDPRIYSTRMLRIPLPQYYVVYNGDSKEWDEESRKLRLSDMFEKELPEDEKGDFEWTATVINLNHGKNETLKSRSEILHGYCRLVDLVKEYRKKYALEQAIDRAVKQCIEEGILVEILREHESEVKRMCLTEFDEEAYIAMIRSEEREEGRAEGLAEGRAEGLAEGHAEGLAEGHAEGLAEGLAEGHAEGSARTREEFEKALELHRGGEKDAQAYREAGISDAVIDIVLR